MCSMLPGRASTFRRRARTRKGADRMPQAPVSGEGKGAQPVSITRFKRPVLRVEAAKALYVAEQLERAALGQGDLENLKRAPGVLCVDQSAGSGDAGVSDHPIEEPW